MGLATGLAYGLDTGLETGLETGLDLPTVISWELIIPMNKAKTKDLN